MKKYKALLPLLLIFILAVVGRQMNKIPELKLIHYSGEDGINQFYIDNGFVYIDGALTVKNNTSKNLSFSFTAESYEDFENGLLKSPELTVYDESLTTMRFSISPKEEKTYHVFFVGEHSGGTQKDDRLIPDIIKITAIEKVS